MNLVIAFASPIVQDKIGTNITFVWTGFLIFSFLFAFFCIPETKGMSIEEVDALYLSHTPAWRSNQFRQDQEAAEIKGQEKHYAKSHHEEQKAEGEPNSNRTSGESATSV
jgi:SP family sugar:H+ symporter-like MFS transporter